MKLKDIKKILKAEVIMGTEYLDQEVETACGSDLLSDALAFIKPKSLLLTGITNLQVLRTAEMSEIIAICFVHGKMPLSETLKLANKDKEIFLFSTRLSMYEACGKLYEKGLPGYNGY